MSLVDPEAQQYIKSLNELIRLNVAQDKILKLIQASKVTPSQKRAGVRQTASPKELTPNKPGKKSAQKKAASKRVVDLIVEGLRYLLKSNPKLAADEGKLEEFMKSVMSGESSDLSNLFLMNKTRRKEIDFKELVHVDIQRKKRKSNPDENDEVNLLGTRSGKSSVNKDFLGTKPAGNKSGKSSVSKDFLEGKLSTQKGGKRSKSKASIHK